MILTPPNDLIDNREARIIEAVVSQLDGCDRAHFALGHLHLPGLTPVIGHLGHLTQLRLLIGNATHDVTIEQLFERHLEHMEVERQVEANSTPNGRSSAGSSARLSRICGSPSL